MRRRGFTLIELLVTVAILTVLAGVLLPVFAQAREKARQARCLGNVRQLGMAIGLYLQDHDEFYPLSIYPVVASGAVRPFTLFDAILPYCREPALVTCPTGPQAMDMSSLLRFNPPAGCFGGRLGLPSGTFNFFSYNANYSLFRRGAFNPYFPGAGAPPLSLSDLPRPGETSLVYDGFLLCTLEAPIARPGQPPRHHEGVNVTYADGRVQFARARCDPGLTYSGVTGVWVVASGPYSGRPELRGLVREDGSIGESP